MYPLFLEKKIIKKVHKNDKDNGTNEYEEGILAIAPECALGWIYRTLWKTRNAQRGDLDMVSTLFLNDDTLGVYWIAEGGVEEALANRRMWYALGTSLVALLFLHQVEQCIHRSGVLCEYGILYFFL